MSKRNYYKEVTDKMIAKLREFKDNPDQAQWVKPWSGTGYPQSPTNMVTGNEYHGVNFITLWLVSEDYGNSNFMTFKQAQQFNEKHELNVKVRKGEHGHPVMRMVDFIPRKFQKKGEMYFDPDTKTLMTEEEARRFTAKFFTVFNADQFDGMPDQWTGKEEDEVVDPSTLLGKAVEFTEGFPGTVRKRGSNRAFYSLRDDAITVPMIKQFDDHHAFIATLFHEMIHWTGHESRLNRDMANKFGSDDYAKEELVAELGAAFMCARFGIEGQLQHAEYLNSWIKQLGHDEQMFFHAASDAQKAVDYLVKVTSKQEVAA